jgi:hypothetical protein
MDISFKDDVTVVILLGVSFAGDVNKHHRVDATGAGIFKESMGARNRGGIGLSYRPARLHRLALFIPWNRLLGSINV